MKGLFLAQVPQGQVFPQMMSLLPLILIFFVFYFLLILPQRRKQKQHEQLLKELKPGDRVTTVGGILGRVEKINGDVVTLRLAENVAVDFVRNSIAQVEKKP